MQELVKESANFVLRGSNVKCEFSFPADFWHVEADEGKISQVLTDLTTDHGELQQLRFPRRRSETIQPEAIEQRNQRRSLNALLMPY
jgi:hypothetical protein